MALETMSDEPACKRPRLDQQSETQQHDKIKHNDVSSLQNNKDQVQKKSKKRIPRPMNSFMVFAKEYRKELQRQNPTYDNKIISKMLGSKWANLTPQEKQKYSDEAKRLAEEHKLKYPDWKFTRDTSKRKKKTHTLSQHHQLYHAAIPHQQQQFDFQAYQPALSKASHWPPEQFADPPPYIGPPQFVPQLQEPSNDQFSQGPPPPPYRGPPPFELATRFTLE